MSKGLRWVSRKVKGVGLAVAGVVGSALPAMAGDVVPDGATIDTSDITTMAGVIVVALLAIWPIKKVLKLGNRT
jgi:fucose permease